ncbi:MAG: GntR family transcriptional regulator [Emergencia sp.]|nr:GntR family transcriptional regulator [Emergencia sp.]
MDNFLNDSLPIYVQIMDSVRAAIVSGELAAGQKVAPVRELAEDFGVNPNTMQRALAELEREGLLISERTAGRFVTRDLEIINKARQDAAERIVRDFLQKMSSLGYNRTQIEEFFRTMDLMDFHQDAVI